MTVKGDSTFGIVYSPGLEYAARVTPKSTTTFFLHARVRIDRFRAETATIE